MLDIAERCFVRIAEAIISKNLTVKKAFDQYIIREEVDDAYIDLLSPIGLLEGIKELGITDF